jgi:hypothetical protein
MKRLLFFLAVCLLVTTVFFRMSSAVQYEPPINIVFMVHVEPMDFPGDYETRIAFLEWLQQEAQSRPNPFKLTILMNGDFAEYAYFNGDQQFFSQLETDGHELGTHAHSIIQVAPFSWFDLSELTYRYGIPVYNDTLSQQLWWDAKHWADSLTTANRSICAGSFLCSTEGQLITANGFLCSPGSRSEKCLDYTGHLMRHPFRPGSDNRLGYELEENLSSPFIYIDHYAQIGNSNAHGYNCTAVGLMNAFADCYQDWVSAEMTQGDSLEYKVWTFGFLTHLWLYSPYYEEQITLFLDYLESYYVGQYTPRGNLIARYATCSEVADELITWEGSHPGESSFSYVHSYPEVPLVNEAMIVPEDSLNGSEWIEFYNPTDQWIDISGYKISDGQLNVTNYWRFPPQCFLGPREHLVAVGNGSFFWDRYGFRPDFEVAGNTGARPLYTEGYYTLHDDRDGCMLVNTDQTPPKTNTAIADGLSWGEDYVAGFTLPQPTVGQTYGRDANSTDTGFADDWSLNGGASSPTPRGANSPAYFGPEIFARVDPVSIPSQVDPWGGNVLFTITLGNEYSSVRPIDAWTDVVLPSGSVYGPLLLRENRNLAAQDSFSLNLSQYVPAGAPTGYYRFNFSIGDYPSEVISSGYFYFEKLGSADGAEAQWPEPDFAELDARLSRAMQISTQKTHLTLSASPNPFNPTTILSFNLPAAGAVELSVYDAAGRLVFERDYKNLSPGEHHVTFDGKVLCSGIYFASLRSGSMVARTKILLLK